MKTGIYEIFEAEIEGWRLLVPKSYLDATVSEIDAKTGGCGPGSIGDWFVPDTMYGESVFLACRIHDWMYGEGKDELDKRIADRVFLWNMTVLIQDVPHVDVGIGVDQVLDTLRLRRVMTYYQAVSYAGGGAFDKGDTPKRVDVPMEDDQVIEG